MAATIQFVKARQIFDSRGNPTVEVDIGLSNGIKARAAVPSGASTGVYEALELRDGGSDYLGKGVSKAVANVNTIIGPALIGKDPTEQTSIDNFMVQQLDGTVNEWGWCKQKLGANAILAVSLAVCKAGANALNIPLYKHIANLAGNKSLVLPVPAFNVINGGSHAGNKLAMQEFMILPVGASSFKEAMKMGVEVYHNLKSVIKKKYGQDATNVGDEGGFAPNIQENKEGLELLKTAIAKAGYTNKVVIGMDVAASEFYGPDKTYDLNFKEEGNDGSQKISGDALKELYKSFVAEYPIVSIEDPFDQDDWEHYAKMTAEIGDKVQIVGDDLLVTNPKRVEKAINEKSCNALLLKVNQIGSVTESIEAVKMSKRAGWDKKPRPDSANEERSDYIRRKYEYQQFMTSEEHLSCPFRPNQPGNGNEKKHKHQGIGHGFRNSWRRSEHKTTKKSNSAAGMVEFVGLVKVNIVKGTRLAVRDMVTSDPYVVLSLGSQSVKTRVIKNNLNPVWNEQLMLSIPEEVPPLKVLVYDKDKFTTDDFMGEAEIDIQPLLTAAKENEKNPAVDEGMQLGKWEANKDNALAKDSVITLNEGKVKQEISLRLQNVERGVLELELECVPLTQ